jgi:hypothetical protein
MLRDRYCRLLTAYVDGVLSPGQLKAVQRLLDHSAEAQNILQQLQENAQKVQNLPQHQLGPEFPAQVLEKVQPLPPVANPVPAAGIPTWIGVSAAAAVLLMVAFGSYLFFRSENSPGPEHPIGPVVRKEKPLEKAIEPKAIDPIIAEILQGTAHQFAKSVEVGKRFVLGDLAKAPSRASLDDHLKKVSAVHLDLTCNNGVQAVERLKTVLKGNGITVLVDAKVSAKPAAKKGKAILVYAENIRPDELTTILQQLGQGDRPFDSVLVDALTDTDRKQVARLLGVKAEELPPSPPQDLPTFIPKDKGKDPKKGNNVFSEPPRLPNRFALVMTLANGSGAASAEVQQFLRSRTRLRRGTLQVVVVLNPSA